MEGGIASEPQMHCSPGYRPLLSFNVLKLKELNPEALFSHKSLASNSLFC